MLPADLFWLELDYKFVLDIPFDNGDGIWVYYCPFTPRLDYWQETALATVD